MQLPSKDSWEFEKPSLSGATADWKTLAGSAQETREGPPEGASQAEAMRRRPSAAGWQRRRRQRLRRHPHRLLPWIRPASRSSNAVHAAISDISRKGPRPRNMFVPGIPTAPGSRCH